MLELLEKYIKDGNINDALLVGQNLFNKNKDSKDIFIMYFNLLNSAISNNKEEANKYIEQMSLILSIFAENIELSEAEISFIRECENQINKLVFKFNEESKLKKEEEYKRIIINNDSFLKKAKGLIEKLNLTTNKKTFDDILKEIYELDYMISKEKFVLSQKNEYEEITNNCQKIVNLKLKYLRIMPLMN